MLWMTFPIGNPVRSIGLKSLHQKVFWSAAPSGELTPNSFRLNVTSNVMTSSSFRWSISTDFRWGVRHGGVGLDQPYLGWLRVAAAARLKRKTHQLWTMCWFFHCKFAVENGVGGGATWKVLLSSNFGHKHRIILIPLKRYSKKHLLHDSRCRYNSTTVIGVSSYRQGS